MKVLFLDIDGVINTVGAELGFQYMKITPPTLEEQSVFRLSKYFDPACIYYLHTIVEETECKIVISSSWRYGASLETMKKWFKDPLISNAIIDKTEILHPNKNPDKVDRQGRIQRGEEILEWLERHPEVTKFAVLDDDDDMDAIRHNFFQTDRMDGLKRKVAYKVISFLNSKDHIDHYRMNIKLNNFLAEIDDALSSIKKDSRNIAKNKIINIVKELIIEYKTRNSS